MGLSLPQGRGERCWHLPCSLVLGSLCSGTEDARYWPCWDVDAGTDRQTQAGGGSEQARPILCCGNLAVPAVTPSSQGDY